jgi:hypothetical protein
MKRPTLILASCIPAAAVTFLCGWLLPLPLSADAEIIGYPVFHNYNSPLFIKRYWLLVAFFPLLSFILFELQKRRVSPSARAGDEISEGARPAVTGEARRRRPWLARLARVALVGWVLSLGGVGLWLVPLRGYFLQALLLTAGYALLVLAVALFSCRLRIVERLEAGVSCANAFGALSTISALYGVSRSTRVWEVGGAPRPFPWLPALPVVLALAVGGSLLAAAVRRRGRDDVALERIEAWTVHLTALPVLLFLLHARLPPEVTSLDLFHVGETVASAEILSKGYFPWRDLLFIHGLIEDPGRSWVGFQVFGESIWGAAAGQSVLLIPLTWVSAYCLYLGMYSRSPVEDFRAVLMGGVLLPLLIPPAAITTVVRYLPFPWTALAFLALLRRPGPFRATLFAVLLFLQTILVPELTLALPGFALALVLFEWQSHAGEPLFRRFPETLRVAATVLVCTGILVAWLARHHAVGGLIDYYRVFGRGHGLKGSIPIQPGDRAYDLQIVAAITSFGAGSWWFFSSLRARRRFSAEDCLALALLLFGMVYFQKFLWRPDAEHLLLAFLVAAPTVVHTTYRGVRWLDRALHRPLSSWLLAVMVLAATPCAAVATNDLRHHVMPALRRGESDLRLGYVRVEEEASLVERASALGRVLRDGGRDGRVFDFTNQPALIHFLLGALPSTPYFHISMAISRESQRLLLAALDADPPTYAIYYASTAMWRWDEIPSSVRHRDVSEYLLRNYEPLHPAADNVVLRRRGAAELGAADPRVLYPQVLPCDWGYVPHFDGPPDGPTRELATLAHRTEALPSGFRTSLEDLPGRLDSASYLELAFDDLGEDELSLRDGDEEKWEANRGKPITFRALAEGRRTYYIQVGACPQWYAFSGERLFLESKRDHRLRRARLLAREGSP